MSPPRSSPARAARALAGVAPLTTRWIERLLAGHDPPLTVPQYLAMRAIAEEDISGGELARRTGVSGPAVSQLLAGLVEQVMVERKPVTADRRRRRLQLTRRGRQALSSADKLLGDRLGMLLGDLPRPEAEALARALPRVESVLSGSAPPRRPRPPAPPEPGRDPKPRRAGGSRSRAR